jgi:hypothetical protein
MSVTHVSNASNLTNTELVAELGRLARTEREASVALIVHLAEFDARRLYEREGFSSLFKYCMSVLRLSEDAVYNRIEAARVARRYPVVVDMLVEGSLSLTTARLLARRLTPDNHEELLAAASGKGKEEVEKLLARRFPEPDVPSSIRKLASREATPTAAGTTMSIPASPISTSPIPDVLASQPLMPGSPSASGGAEASSVAGTAPVAPRALVRPLAPDRYEIRFTASEEMRDKLRLAQDLLGHAIPSGDLAQVFDRALTLLVDNLMRKKHGATRHPRPRSSCGQSGDSVNTGDSANIRDSANILAAVRRTVFARDAGRCAYVAMNGRRCGERRFIEYHHVHPRGAGGTATVENIQLRCRAHNGYEVELFYGPEKRYRGGGVVREAQATYGRGTRAGRTRSGTSDRSGRTTAGVSDGEGRDGRPAPSLSEH